MKNEFKGRNILLVAKPNLQNGMLCYFLQNEVGTPCRVISSEELTESSNLPLVTPGSLFLVDCVTENFEHALSIIPLEEAGVPASPMKALFNVRPNNRIEEKALSRGVRGIFYESDTLEAFVKGINMIYEGGLWLSEDVIRRSLNGGSAGKEAPAQELPALSNREIEILKKVAAGYTNIQIADHLCISSHTVRTHLYRIFQKIKVSNRLEAAVWTVKHLNSNPSIH